jgi:hypothetical protein
MEHEEWGIRTRNVFLGVMALEAIGFVLWRSPKPGQREGAAAIVQTLVTDYPDVPRLKQRLDALK